MIAQEHAPSYQQHSTAAHLDGLPSAAPWPCSYFRHGLLLWPEGARRARRRAWRARRRGAAGRMVERAERLRALGGAGLLNG